MVSIGGTGDGKTMYRIVGTGVVFFFRDGEYFDQDQKPVEDPERWGQMPLQEIGENRPPPPGGGGVAIADSQVEEHHDVEEAQQDPLDALLPDLLLHALAQPSVPVELITSILGLMSPEQLAPLLPRIAPLVVRQPELMRHFIREGLRILEDPDLQLLETLPAEFLEHLPLSLLPVHALVRIPIDTLLQLSIEKLSELPARFLRYVCLRALEMVEERLRQLVQDLRLELLQALARIRLGGRNYVAPEPEFELPDESMVTALGETALVNMLRERLIAQTVARNYDRMIYINAFLSFMERNPGLSMDEALATFDVDSAALVVSAAGGHCSALSCNLLRQGGLGEGAYLVASQLPADYQQEGAPEYCHVAAMIRFRNPEDENDQGLILLEPGFNITEPIVVRPGPGTRLDVGEEVWVFTLSEDGSEIVCQPEPKDSKVKWKERKKKDKRMIYRTDRFLNPDLSLTVPLLRVDQRPQILARDEKGNVVAVIAVNYKKGVVEFRIGKQRFDPVDFADVDREGVWLGGAAEALAQLFHMSKAELIARIYQAVTKGKEILHGD